MKPDPKIPDLGFKEFQAGLPVSQFDTADGVVRLIETTFDVISTLVAFLAIAGLIISGIMYITASGDADKAQRAKRNMLWIVIGMIIYILSLWILPTLYTALFSEIIIPAQQASLLEQIFGP